MTLKPNIWNKHQIVTAGSLNQTSPPSEREESELYTCSAKKNHCCPFLKQTLSITSFKQTGSKNIRQNLDTSWTQLLLLLRFLSFSGSISLNLLRQFVALGGASLAVVMEMSSVWSGTGSPCSVSVWVWKSGEEASSALTASWSSRFFLGSQGSAALSVHGENAKVQKLFDWGHQPTVILNKDIKLALPFSSPVRVFTFTYHFSYHCDPNIHHYYYFNF